MKKRIVCLFLAMLMVFMVVSCRVEPTTPEDPTDDETTADQTDATTGDVAVPVYLGKNNKAQYTMILAQGLNADVTDRCANLRSAFDDVVDAKLDRTYDSTPEVKREILVGLTTRAESQAAKEKLGANEYILEMNGDKLVLLGANDAALIAALDELMAIWTAEDGAIWVPSTLSIKKSLPGTQLKLMNGSEFQFSVIRSSSSSSDVGAAAANLRNDLQELFADDKITCTLDTTTAADTNAYEILIGNTNRPESKEAYKNLNALGYRITVIGNKITVAASSDSQLAQACNALFIILRNAKNGTIIGDVAVNSELLVTSNMSVMNQEWFLSIPALTDGELTDGYIAGNNSCILERKNATLAGFNDYVKTLDDAGFTGEDYELGNNRYAIRHGEQATVYVSYSATSKSIRLYSEVKGTFKYPAKDQTSTVNTYEPKLWQLRVDNIGSRQNGGMSYVWLLADGTFFVIDGGYNTDAEARKLCKFLVDHNPRQGKPVVRGWYFSHTHGDHIGAFQKVAANYSSTIDLQAVYSHFENSATATSFNNSLKSAWPNAVHYARIHTGMQIELPGITVNVIYTLEDQYSRYPENGNDYSAVIRVDVTAKGTTQKVMFLGDIQKQASECMLKYMGNEIMKSDIVQFSHHGYEGATRQVYNAIEAPTVLWPMNYVSTQESYGSVCNVFSKWYLKNSGGEGFMANQMICTSAKYCKQIIVAGGSASQEITFPHTATPYTNGQSGTNGRLPDINAEYDRVLKELLPGGYGGAF